MAVVVTVWRQLAVAGQLHASSSIDYPATAASLALRHSHPQDSAT